MSDGKHPNPMFTDNGENPVFTAFQNLSLGRNNSNMEQRGFSNRSDNNNNNLNVQYNACQFSVEGLRAPPPWITQPSVASSSTNPCRPIASPRQSFVNYSVNFDEDLLPGSVFEMMTLPTRQYEFQRLLARYDTYPTAERENLLLRLGSVLIRDQSTFLALAKNQNGSYALRTLLRRTPGLDELIFKAVCANFYSLMNCKYGRHLIIPTIRAVDKPLKEILYQLTWKNALYLAKQETGCIALNDVLEEIRGGQRDLILHLIARNAQWLSFDPYGTHVVQNVLTLQNPLATRVISQKLSGNFFRLAMGRQGSYVVEKCLKSQFGRDKVLEEFRGNDRDWARLANDKFGNFVAQCAFKVMMQNGMTRLLIEFVDKLRPHFEEMKVGHGKNTLRIIEEEIDEWIRIQFQENLMDSLD